MSPYRARDHMAPAFLPPRHPMPAIADFLRLLAARRNLITRIALATILFALSVALLLPATYASSAVVLLERQETGLAGPSAMPQPGDPVAVQNQIQIITSRD